MNRCLSRDAAALYLGVSLPQVDWLIHTGALPTVRFPVQASHTGKGRVGMNRRVLIDRCDLDRLVDTSKVRP